MGRGKKSSFLWGLAVWCLLHPYLSVSSVFNPTPPSAPRPPPPPPLTTPLDCLFPPTPRRKFSSVKKGRRWRRTQRGSFGTRAPRAIPPPPPAPPPPSPCPTGGSRTEEGREGRQKKLFFLCLLKREERKPIRGLSRSNEQKFRLLSWRRVQIRYTFKERKKVQFAQFTYRAPRKKSITEKSTKKRYFTKHDCSIPPPPKKKTEEKNRKKGLKDEPKSFHQKNPGKEKRLSSSSLEADSEREKKFFFLSLFLPPYPLPASLAKRYRRKFPSSTFFIRFFSPPHPTPDPRYPYFLSLLSECTTLHPEIGEGRRRRFEFSLAT